MTPVQMIEPAAVDGVRLALTALGTINATGGHAAVNRWLATIRDSKPEIVDLLRGAASERDTFHREAFEERAAILEFDGGYDALPRSSRRSPPAKGNCDARRKSRHPLLTGIEIRVFLGVTENRASKMQSAGNRLLSLQAPFCSFNAVALSDPADLGATVRSLSVFRVGLCVFRHHFAADPDHRQHPLRHDHGHRRRPRGGHRGRGHPKQGNL